MKYTQWVRNGSMLAVMACLTCWLGAAEPASQPTTGAASGPAASKVERPAITTPRLEPVLGHIPADSLGFAVINNLADGTGDVDTFLQDAGIMALAKDEMPDGSLAALLSELKMGESFNPNGGLAVVMLDPNAFGIDLVKLIRKKALAAASTQPATGEANEPKLPFVIFLPGSDPAKLLPQAEIKEVSREGDFIKLTDPTGDVFLAAKLGGYVILSPSAPALSAVLNAPKRLDGELSEAQMESISGSAVAVEVNMKIAAPLIAKGLKALELYAKAQEEGLMDESAGPHVQWGQLSELLGLWGPALNGLLPQMERCIFTARMSKTGIVLDGVAAYRPDSVIGKNLAACNAATAPLLDSLPDLPYFLAFGDDNTALKVDPTARDMQLKQLDYYLAKPELAKLDEATRAKIKELVNGFLEQSLSHQLVLGGSAADSGVFSMAMVLKCKDAEKTKALLAGSAEVIESVCKQLLADTPGIEKFKITYNPKAQKVDDVQADTITVTDSPLDEAGMFHQVWGSLMGEEDIRVLVFSPDANTVVLTCGGTDKTMSEALKATNGKGDILSGDDAAEALKHMPRNLHDLVFFNVKNFVGLMLKVAQQRGGQDMSSMVQFNCKVPVAVGGGSEGLEWHMAAYIPTKVVQDVVTTVAGFTHSMGRPAPPKPMPNGQDF